MFSDSHVLASDKDSVDEPESPYYSINDDNEDHECMNSFPNDMDAPPMPLSDSWGNEQSDTVQGKEWS